MKYVILKEINDIWYATEKRYTLEELKTVCTNNNLDVDYDELLENDVTYPTEYGIVIRTDDGRELIRDGKHSYLTDTLEIGEPLKVETNHTLLYIILGIVLTIVVVNNPWVLIPSATIAVLYMAMKYSNKEETAK